MRKKGSRKAGRYAEQRYRQGLQRWRARIRPYLIAIFGPFIVAGIVVLIVEGHPFSWLAGAVAGNFIGAWIWIRDAPPRYVEQWQDGLEGERKTEKALRPLERAGWHVTHEIDAHHGGNYDHIVVGHAGVFLLDSKNPQGFVELRDGVPHLRRSLDPDADTPLDRIRPKVLRAAVTVKEDIERRTGHSVWVQGVVVFWSNFSQELVNDGRCVFVDGKQLRSWLQSQPTRLSDVAVTEIAEAVTALADPEPRESALATQ